MQRPNRVAVLFAIPLAIFMMLIGWTLLSAGSKQKANQTKTSPKEPTLVIMQPNQQIIA